MPGGMVGCVNRVSDMPSMPADSSAPRMKASHSSPNAAAASDSTMNRVLVPLRRR